MTKKPITQRGLGKASDRNRSGRYEKASSKGGAGSYKYAASVLATSYKPKSKDMSALRAEPKLARPVEQRVDPCEFAAELLITDEIIMDYLAK
jgi:hypothetical protein